MQEIKDFVDKDKKELIEKSMMMSALLGLVYMSIKEILDSWDTCDSFDTRLKLMKLYGRINPTIKELFFEDEDDKEMKDA